MYSDKNGWLIGKSNAEDLVFPRHKHGYVIGFRVMIYGFRVSGRCDYRNPQKEYHFDYCAAQSEATLIYLYNWCMEKIDENVANGFEPLKDFPSTEEMMVIRPVQRSERQMQRFKDNRAQKIRTHIKIPNFLKTLNSERLKLVPELFH